MGKHRHNSGFTLVEMLLVLSLLSFCLLLFPFIRQQKQAMPLRMELLREQLLIVQGKAMREAKTISIHFEGTSLRYENSYYELGMKCNGSVVFHPNGNVDRAKTIVCTLDSYKGELIIQLGSGRMYVKK